MEKQSVSPVVLSPQASRLIVTFDEHVISNNFKFGVIYQKLGQVCSPPPPRSSHPAPGGVSGASDLCQEEHLPGDSVSQELRGCQFLLPDFSGCEWGLGSRGCSGSPAQDLFPLCVPRPLRKNSSAPMRKAPPSWSSLNFWGRRSNCRTLRGEH